MLLVQYLGGYVCGLSRVPVWSFSLLVWFCSIVLSCVVGVMCLLHCII